MIVEEEEFQEPPEAGTQRYQEIVKIGCGLHYDEWNGDYDCLHHYGWSCEECPVAQQAQKHGDERLNEFVFK